MPKIEKQASPNGPQSVTRMTPTRTTTPKRPGSDQSKDVLNRITSVSEQTIDGVKLLVYGRTKLGKTTFASTFPKPMLLIGTEDGTKSVRDVDGLDFVRIYEADELDLITEEIKGKNKRGYRSVGLDTAGGVQDLVMVEHLKLSSVPTQKTYMMARKQDWGVISHKCKDKFKGLLDLADMKQMDVCIIAHERDFSKKNDEEESGEDQDQDLKIEVASVGAALTPGICDWLNGSVDYIAQCYKRREMKTTTKEVEGETIERTSWTGKWEYCLRVGDHGKYSTGFRRIRSSQPLPESIPNPTYAKLVALI